MRPLAKQVGAQLFVLVLQYSRSKYPCSCPLFRNGTSMNRKFLLVSLAALVAASLLLTSCSGGNSKSEVSEGPLTKYFTQIDELAATSNVDLAEQQEKTEEFVASCMTAEGFEYTPEKVNPEDYEDMSSASDKGPEWGSVEFAKEYGFGIATWPGDDLEADDETITAEEEAEQVSPNEKYVESLSESEQEAYYFTLYGDQEAVMTDLGDLEMEGGSGESVVEEPDPADLGCYAKADAEINKTGDPATAIYEDPAYEELWTALDDFYNELEEPKIMDTLDEEWQKCMTDKGFGDLAADGREEVSTALYEEYEALTAGEDEAEFIELDAEANAEFAKREIEIAVPDAECARQVKYNERVAAEYNKQEQVFVDQHKAELDALVAGAKKLAK